MADWTLRCGHSVHDGCDCGEPCYKICEQEPDICLRRQMSAECRFYPAGRSVSADMGRLRAEKKRLEARVRELERELEAKNARR